MVSDIITNGCPLIITPYSRLWGKFQIQPLCVVEEGKDKSFIFFVLRGVCVGVWNELAYKLVSFNPSFLRNIAFHIIFMLMTPRCICP